MSSAACWSSDNGTLPCAVKCTDTRRPTLVEPPRPTQSAQTRDDLPVPADMIALMHIGSTVEQRTHSKLQPSLCVAVPRHASMLIGMPASTHHWDPAPGSASAQVEPPPCLHMSAVQPPTVSLALAHSRHKHVAGSHLSGLVPSCSP